MIIKKLELQGFKSFAERTKLILHPGITAVIGPNGTGKSNIVDALLWVLRGRRLKALRGDRSGDVIFNGNDKKAPLGMADVSLFLGSDKKEMKINHRIFRSGESEYRMDGKTVRLKDIQDALWKNSIGETNYFVIEQGSIGAFLSSKPVEKRALLEEAAGTAFYKEKKRQAENKLESTEQNLLRLEDIISEVNKGKNSLQRQAGAAKRYRKLREKTRELTLLLYRKKLHSFEQEHREVSQNYQKYLDAERGWINRLKNEEKELAEIRKKVWMSEKNLNEEKDNLYALKTQYSNLHADREREEKRKDYFEEKKEKSKQEILEFKQELKILNKNKQESEKTLIAYQEDLKQKQESLEKAEKSNLLYLEKLNQKEKNKENLRDEYYQKISFQTEIKNKEAKLDKEIEMIEKQENRIEAELSSESQDLSNIQKEIERKKEEILRTQKKVSEKTKELENQKNSLKETEEAIHRLEETLVSLDKRKSENLHHLNTLIKLKQKEQNAGHTPELKDTFHLLADVMNTDEENAHLVDVFYKQEAKSLLMEPDDFIKQLSKGRIKGNFLLLHPKHKSKSPALIKKEPQFLGLLKSRIKVKQESESYLSLLPEALIVRNLKDAVSLWLKYPECHFITLKGDVLLSSGLIKSGEKEEGLFALTREIKEIDRKINQINNERKPLETRLAEHKKLREKIDKDTEQTRSIISRENQNTESLKKEMSFAEEKKQRRESRITLLHQEKDKLAEEKKRMIREKGQLSLDVEKTGKDITGLKNTLKKEEQDYENLQKKREQENKAYFQIKSQIDVLSEKINHLHHTNSEIEKRTNTINKKLKSLENDIDESDREKELLEKKISDIKQNLKNIEQTKNEKQAALTGAEEKLHDIQKDLSSEEEKIQELRNKSEQAKEQRIKWEIKKAEKERDLINCEETCWQELKKTPDEVKKEASLPEKSKDDIERSLSEIREKLEKIGSVNLMAEEEYNTQKKRYDFLVNQRQDLRESIQSTKKAIKKIDSESKTQFLNALIKVNNNFQDIFSILFNGGNAQIKLSDEDNPLESGLDITAQPPGKKVKNLTLLSGGEKTLTSLAFFFALFRYKPAPFCILDEVDAALDETNLDRFLNLMKEIKNQTQFIIITHNFKTMEVADYIYGTAMPEPNITNIYSVRLQGKQVIKDS